MCLSIEDDERESKSDDDAGEHDLDDESGDLGTEECDKLDEQMWGNDDEDPVKVTVAAATTTIIVIIFIITACWNCMYLCLCL